MATRLPPPRTIRKRPPGAPPPFILPSVEDGVAQVEEFVAELLGTGVPGISPGVSPGVNSNPTRVLKFVFSANGVQSWLVDATLRIVGFFSSAGSSPWQLAGHNPDPFSAIDGNIVGRHIVSGSAFNQFAGCDIRFEAGDTIFVRNETTTTLVVNLFIRNEL